MQITFGRSGSLVSRSTNRLVRGTAYPRSLLLAAAFAVGLTVLAAKTALATGSEGAPPARPSSPSSSFDPIGVVPPAVIRQPIRLRDGSVTEKVTDLEVLGPRFPWTQDRSYDSSRVSSSTKVGGTWSSTNGDRHLTPGTDNAVLFLGSLDFKQEFSFSEGRYVGPKDSKLMLEKYFSSQDACHYFRLTDTVTGQVEIFYDFGGSNSGMLRERTTRDWLAEGKAGTRYSYNSGLLSSVCTAQGQEYYIAFSYTGSGSSAKLTKIEVSTGAGGTLLKDVTYTYFTSGTHSADLGSDGDLVQVRTRELKSGGSSKNSTDWIVRYTQYRYYRSGDSNGVAHLLKAVFEPDAVQRILDDRRDFTSADAILAKGDNDGNSGHQIQDFANRRFTYYTTNLDTAQAVNTVRGSENLQTKFGGSQASEMDASVPRYMVKSAVVGGCGSCGSPGGGSHNYYYVDMNHGTSRSVNDVVRLVVEDTIDAKGAGAFRTIYGLGRSGQKLREALITDPAGTPKFWCQSWKLSGDTTTIRNQLAEYRTAAAHNVTSSTISKFLDPTTATNDNDTLNSSAGLIEVYEYDMYGRQTAEKVKEGASGKAYYVWSKVFQGGTNLNRQSLVIASYTYPQQATAIDDASRIRTHYSYDFWTGTDTIKKRTTNLPTVAKSQNGSGTRTTIEEYYDKLGRLRWTKDGDGYVTYHSYHPKFGTESYVARDADPNSLPSSADKNAAKWVAASAGSADSNKPIRSAGLPKALQQVDKSEFDDEGRVVIETTEDGQTGTDLAKHYTVYEPNRTLRFPYWDGSSNRPLMPIQATVINNGGRTTEIYTLDPSCAAAANGVPTGLGRGDQTNYVTWTRNKYDVVTGKLTSADRYHVIPSSGTGTLSTNYHRDAYLYDAMGRRGATIQVVSGTDANKSTVDQVRVQIFDALGRVVAVKQGVSRSSDGIPASYDALASTQSPPSWLKTVFQDEYDNGRCGGNGLVTRQVRYYGGYSTDNTGAQLYYTFRGHLRGLRSFKNYNGNTDVSVGPYTVDDIDWLGRTTAAAVYTSPPTWPTDYSAYADNTATHRAALSKTYYDTQGRTYRKEQYTINSIDGSKGNRLQADYYYDRRDNQVAVAPKHGAATETAYDGLGRPYQTRTVLKLKGDDGGDFYAKGAFQYRQPVPNPLFSSNSTGSMTGGDDKVLAMRHTVFSAALYTPIESHSFATIDTDTDGLNLSKNNDYVRHSIYSWYDGANRRTAEADYGCGNTSTDTWKYATMPSRPSSAPSSGAAVLVTQSDYDSVSGRLQLVTDPKGQQTKTFYDALGRTTYVAENYDNFCPLSTNTGDPSDHSKDRVTKTEYDGLGEITRLTALDQNGDGTGNNEVTTYLYEAPYNAALVTSTIYPDSSDTDSSGTNQVKVQYNLDGSVAQKTDQRGTVIRYAYNDRRQLQLEGVRTIRRGGPDGSILSIKREYDAIGRPTTITSYGDADGKGPIRNQVVQQYADYGPIVAEWQSHSDAAVTSGENQSPNVRYDFDTSADDDGIYYHGGRLQRVTYPNGRVIYYQYGTKIGDQDDVLGRVTEIRQIDAKGQVLAQYARLGGYSPLPQEQKRPGMKSGGGIVAIDYPEPQLLCTLSPGGTPGTYDGLDRFGRVESLSWANYNTSTNVVQIQHGYDLAGHRIWREDRIAKSQKDTPVYLDECYAYDGLNRLTNLDRGELQMDKGAISGTPATEENWTLDALGNWSAYAHKTDGTTDLNQTRTHDLANQVTQIKSSITYVAGDHVTQADSSAKHVAGQSNQFQVTPVKSSTTLPITHAAGNMTRLPKPGDWRDHYSLVYDAWNRPVKVYASYGYGTLIAEYQYDGRGVRTVKKTFDKTYKSSKLSETRHFYYNSLWQCLEERLESSGAVASTADRQNVWGERYIDELVLRDRDTNADGRLDERLYALQDPNWNVVAVADPSGVVQERYDYNAFGAPAFLTGAFASRTTSSYAWDTLYTGRHCDLETGLYQYRLRPYHAQLGRFSSRDPIGYEAGERNLYCYAGNNPINAGDPLGAASTVMNYSAFGNYYWIEYECKYQVTYVWDCIAKSASATASQSGTCGWGIVVKDHGLGVTLTLEVTPASANETCCPPRGGTRYHVQFNLQWKQVKNYGVYSSTTTTPVTGFTVDCPCTN